MAYSSPRRYREHGIEWAPVIVVTDPGIRDKTQMVFGQWDKPVQAIPPDCTERMFTKAYIFGLWGADFNAWNLNARIDSSSRLANMQSCECEGQTYQ